jgi:anaerobic selenocysteine-containing dehydrogenase
MAPPCGERPVQFVDVLPGTPDRRIDLCPKSLDEQTPSGLYSFIPDSASDAFPLALISPTNSKAISSSLYELVREVVPVEIQPEDALARRIADGDEVRVFNQLGEVRCRAKINRELRPGVASLPKGLWSRHTLNGQTANALVPDTLSDFGGGACYNDARVEIERLDPSAVRR